MADSPRDAVGDFLTVDQVARIRQVTPAAVRAQLRAGSLAGEQVRQGQRTVWRIPASAVRPQREEPGGPPPVVTREPAASPDVPPTTIRPAAREAPSDVEPARPTPGRVEALEAEVRRLRRQLSALAEAHRGLLDVVTAGLSGGE